jgi:hypothetical protein
VRYPERADTSAFVEDLRNVAAFFQDSHAQKVVFDLNRLTPLEYDSAHGRFPE